MTDHSPAQRASADTFNPPPKARPLPKLAFWLFARKLTFREVAEPFGCSHEYVRLISLPFDDPARRVPTSDVVERIHRYTGGEIEPADHYPPHLNGQSAAEDIAEAVS